MGMSPSGSLHEFGMSPGGSLNVLGMNPDNSLRDGNESWWFIT